MKSKHARLLAAGIACLLVIWAVLRINDPERPLHRAMDRHGLRQGIVLYGTPERVSGTIRIASRPDRTFPYYSLSKPVTAATVLALADAGKMDLDGTFAGASVRQLLSHSGGWDRAIAGDPVTSRQEPADCVRIGVPPRQFAPGSRAAYSNLGYCLLGALIEDATGMSYERAVRQALPEARDMGYDAWLGPAGGWSGTAEQYYRFASRPVDPRALVRPAFAPTGPYYGMGWRVLADGTISHYGIYGDGYSVVFKRPGWVAVGLFDGRPADGEAARDELLKALSGFR